MNTTTKTFTLPDSHLAVLHEESIKMEISIDKALEQSIRFYQLINHNARLGLHLAFIDKSGNIVKNPIFMSPELY